MAVDATYELPNSMYVTIGQSADSLNLLSVLTMHAKALVQLSAEGGLQVCLRKVASRELGRLFGQRHPQTNRHS
ncbi:MAG: hypothetical protein HQ478_07000 [Chloroflexi bacterium]|nr:hypothetical protein [Chloroflexota bacterium]